MAKLKNATSKNTGVYKRSNGGYEANLFMNGKTIYLGTVPKQSQARTIRDAAIALYTKGISLEAIASQSKKQAQSLR